MTRPTEPAVDLDNMQAVLEWCVASGRPEDAAALTAANLWPWFVTGRAQEALQWLEPPGAPDEALPLDDRLARATAVTWLAFPAMDVTPMSDIDAYIRLAPPDHPAQVPLRFLKAWTLVWSDRDTSRRLLASVRTCRPDDTAYRQESDVIEGWGLLLDDRPAEAALSFSSAVGHQAGHVRAAELCLAMAHHLDGRHDLTTATLAGLDRDYVERRGFFLDLIASLVAVMEAVGREDVATARRTLADLLDETATNYPHIPTAAGFGIQAAAVVAYAAGRPVDAITLLSGSRRHGLHVRFEGATALGRRYLRLSREVVSDEDEQAAAEQGAGMTVDELIGLARQVATDTEASEG
jgi:hypothetical protein